MRLAQRRAYARTLSQLVRYISTEVLTPRRRNARRDLRMNQRPASGKCGVSDRHDQGAPGVENMVEPCAPAFSRSLDIARATRARRR